MPCFSAYAAALLLDRSASELRPEPPEAGHDPAERLGFPLLLEREKTGALGARKPREAGDGGRDSLVAESPVLLDQRPELRELVRAR